MCARARGPNGPGSLIDQDQPGALGEGVEVIGELMVIEAGTAVQDDDRQARC